MTIAMVQAIEHHIEAMCRDGQDVTGIKDDLRTANQLLEVASAEIERVIVKGEAPRKVAPHTTLQTLLQSA